MKHPDSRQEVPRRELSPLHQQRQPMRALRATPETLLQFFHHLASQAGDMLQLACCPVLIGLHAGEARRRSTGELQSGSKQTNELHWGQISTLLVISIPCLLPSALAILAPSTAPRRHLSPSTALSSSLLSLPYFLSLLRDR